jgi:hypothetical protein
MPAQSPSPTASFLRLRRVVAIAPLNKFLFQAVQVLIAQRNQQRPKHLVKTRAGEPDAFLNARQEALGCDRQFERALQE